MSYRYHYMKINNEFFEKIKDMNFETLMEYAKLNCKKSSFDDGTFFLSGLFETEICEFGNLLDLNRILPLSIPLFTKKEMMEEFEEYKPHIITQDAFLETLYYIQDLIVENFEHLLKEPEDEHDRTVEDKLKSYVYFRLNEWSFYKDFEDKKNGKERSLTPFDTSKNRDSICMSNTLEYDIFELTRVYKTFNFEKEKVVLLGW